MLNVSSDSYKPPVDITKSYLQFFYNILAEIKLIKETPHSSLKLKSMSMSHFPQLSSSCQPYKLEQNFIILAPCVSQKIQRSPLNIHYEIIVNHHHKKRG